MKFIADLHIHSSFSIATARRIDFETLHIWAQLKGVTVISTGDATHPGWFSAIKDKLIPAEPGLYKLNDKDARQADRQVPLPCRGPVRFILSSELCNIYKKGGMTRKNHNLVYFPDINTLTSFNNQLATMGNISSDGRPMLGIDVKWILNLLLNLSDQAFLIPAHIWTPWYSLFGSKTGFDTIEACFEELTNHIFALETGLSSDPLMNWRFSGLKKQAFISNSDAHSPDKIGREATVFNTDLSYVSIFSAIKSRNTDLFTGTIEYFPQAGKYYLDGHRKCNVFLSPMETEKINGICPVCEKPLLIGVLHRVEMLSEKSLEPVPENRPSISYLLPLKDILGYLLQAGPNTKKVTTSYFDIIQQLGNEISILKDLPVEQLRDVGVPLLAEAVDTIRHRKIKIKEGYDGKPGTFELFGNVKQKKPSKGDRLNSTSVSRCLTGQNSSDLFIDSGISSVGN